MRRLRFGLIIFLHRALILQLPKKERVMCLFNPEVLRQKVQDALLILEASREEEEEEEQKPSTEFTSANRAGEPSIKEPRREEKC